MSLDELIVFDVDMKEIQNIIDHAGEKEEKIDWTSAWGKKYPILLKYQNDVNTDNFARRIGLNYNRSIIITVLIHSLC